MRAAMRHPRTGIVARAVARALGIGVVKTLAGLAAAAILVHYATL